MGSILMELEVCNKETWKFKVLICGASAILTSGSVPMEGTDGFDRRSTTGWKATSKSANSNIYNSGSEFPQSTREQFYVGECVYESWRCMTRRFRPRVPH